eukprot:PhF_6_TR27341/c0_g1_i1/m.40177
MSFLIRNDTPSKIRRTDSISNPHNHFYDHHDDNTEPLPGWIPIPDNVNRVVCPRDVLAHILSFTSQQTIWSAFRVCRAWYHCIDRVLCCSQTFYFLAEKLVKHSYRNIESRDVTDESLHRLMVEKRMWWKYVQSLFFAYSELTDEGLDNLFTTVTTLADTLHTLDVSSCFSLTDVIIVRIGNRLPNLTSLDISGVHSLTDTALITAFTTLPNLQHLNISYLTCVNVNVLICIANNLHELKTLLCATYRGNLMDAFKALEPARLTSLTLTKSNMYHDPTKHHELIDICSNLAASLEELYMNGSRVYDTLLSVVCSTFRNLKVLHVGNSSEDSRIRDLIKLTQLQKLDISGRKHLQLESLVEVLKALRKSIREVKLKGCEKVTSRGVLSALQVEFPLVRFI